MMEISEEDAKVIARALAYVNNTQAGELDRIMQSGESAYLKEAAVNKYHSDTEEMTKLHMRLAEAFPALRQGGISAG